MNHKFFLSSCFLLLLVSFTSPLFASNSGQGVGTNFVMYIQEQNGYAPPYAFRTSEGSYLSISHFEIIRKISESGEIVWQRTIAPPDVWLNGIAETADGYVVVGSTWDCCEPISAIIIKLGTDGSLQWSKTYESQETIIFHSISTTADGGFIVQGGGWYRAGTAIVKITANGNILWSKFFDHLRFVKDVSVSDGIILASAVAPRRILKVNNSGSVVWTESLQNTDFNLQSVGSTADNGVILAGKSSRSLILVRMSSDGKVVWNAEYLFKDSWFEISSVKPTSDHGYVLSGTKFSDENNNNPDGFVVKINSKQQLVFRKKFGRSDGNEYAGNVFPIAGGGYAIFGRSGVDYNWDTLFLNVNSEGIVPGCNFFDQLRVQKAASAVVVSRSTEVISRNLALTGSTIEISSVVSTNPSSTTCP
jgi:hypothetical protein